MSSAIPIITFKAGCCDLDQSTKPYKVKAQPRPGYIYLYSEDDLIHFCWRERSVPLDQPELDLVMVPTDGRFVPYETKSPAQPTAKTNGRVFVLKFTSSSQRHLFWLQSKPQGRSGDPAWLSPRDLKIGEIVDRLLQGEEFDVNAELASVRNSGNGNDDDDDDQGRHDDGDEAMEDVEGPGGDSGAGGAGADATGGDVRDEGEAPREGGADGARAASSSAPDAAAAVQNFLRSLQGGGPGFAGSQQAGGKAYPMLTDLLDRSVTIPMADTASEEQLDSLLSFLPPSIANASQSGSQPQGMTVDQKRSAVKKVLRSPQFHQSLASLSMALRDGGLPSIADALGIRVENGGLVRGGSMPLGGAEAVEAFVEGVKKKVQEKK